MSKDQWVPCDDQWNSKFPDACPDTPTRPAREGVEANHFHPESGPPDIQAMVDNFKVVHTPTVSPRNI